MEELIDEILKRSEELQECIAKEKKTIIVLSALRKGREADQYIAIFNMREIINQSLQYGDYRRALRYLLAAENLLKRIELEKGSAEREMTNLILKR